MSGSYSRRKGNVEEQRVAAAYRAAGFADAHTTRADRGGTQQIDDIAGLPFRVECKRRARQFGVGEAADIHKRGTPVVHVRLDRREPVVVVSEWLWLAMIAALYDDIPEIVARGGAELTRADE